MSRATIIVRGDSDRQKAIHWASKAPLGTRVEFKAPRRTIPQSDRMWACLTDIASQLDWHGIRLTPDDWKLIFLDALKREVRMVPNLEGNGFISLGRSSSDLSKEEMSDCMEIIAAFGAKHGVEFHDGNRGAAGGQTNPAACAA